MSTYLITGVNRGIGLELLKQAAAIPENTVIGVVRDKSKFKEIEELKLSNVKLIAVDMIATQEEFDDAFSVLKEWAPEGLDVVIHNAGVTADGVLSKVVDHQYSEFERLIAVNLFGTVKFYKAVYPYLTKPLKFIYISTVASTITDMAYACNSYGASKAAANYFIKQISMERKGDVVVPVHPGLVATDMMSGFESVGLISSAESASKILQLAEKLTPEDSGKFWSYDGSELRY